MTIVDEVLAHFGVRGMKWGVRKESSTSGSPSSSQQPKADYNWGKKANSYKIRKQVYNASAVRMTKVELPRLNSRPEFKGADFRKDSPLRRTYLNQAVTVFNRVLNEESTRLLGPSPSGKYELHFTQGLDNQYPQAEITQVVKHSVNDVQINLIWSPDGHLIGCEAVDSGMTQADSVIDDVITHFGVRGMKWGVRRTEAEIHGDSANATSAAKKAKRHGTKSLSNKELQDLITRMNLEQQYSRIAPSSKGQKALSAGSKVAADILVGVAKQQATKLASDQAAKLIAAALRNH